MHNYGHKLFVTALKIVTSPKRHNAGVSVGCRIGAWQVVGTATVTFEELLFVTDPNAEEVQACPRLHMAHNAHAACSINLWQVLEVCKWWPVKGCEGAELEVRPFGISGTGDRRYDAAHVMRATLTVCHRTCCRACDAKTCGSAPRG